MNLIPNKEPKQQLLNELYKNSPDFEKVRQIVLSNIELLNTPIDSYGGCVLHYLCW
jgi:hypothetical protein